MDKIFAVYKPSGPTSHDVINEIRKITGIKKIGHAGTLDPLASGVLVIGVGREATKRLAGVVKDEKEYLATVRLGMESATDDEEGKKTFYKINQKPTLADIKKIINNFEGEITQIPPVFSAVKVKGKEAYKRARKGEEITLKERVVSVKKIEILDYRWPDLKLRVVTGPGVYIRALARDVGRELKTGGYLAALERIRVGDFTKNKTIAISDIKRLMDMDYETSKVL